MANRPAVSLFDEIRIDNVRCIVSKVRPQGSAYGDLEVVFNPDKPTNQDVEWSGHHWAFAKRVDLAGYAVRNERLSPFVDKLRGLH